MGKTGLTRNNGLPAACPFQKQARACSQYKQETTYLMNFHGFFSSIALTTLIKLSIAQVIL